LLLCNKAYPTEIFWFCKCLIDGAAQSGNTIALEGGLDGGVAPMPTLIVNPRSFEKTGCL